MLYLTVKWKCLKERHQALGLTTTVFMKQAEYLKRVAQRDVDFFNAYTEEADRLEALEDAGELRASQVKKKIR